MTKSGTPSVTASRSSTTRAVLLAFIVARILTLDARAQRTQAVVDPLVASLDLRDVVDVALAFGAERGDEQTRAGPDVRRLHHARVQPRRADHDGAVRIAQHDARAHADDLVGEEHARLEHLLVDQDRA